MIIIEKYNEVIKRILELLRIIEEGIYDIEEKLLQLRYEEVLTMLIDIETGVASIKNALEPIIPDLIENDIESLTVTLHKKINKDIISYKCKEKKVLKGQMDKELVLVFKNWEKEIQRVLETHTVS